MSALTSKDIRGYSECLLGAAGIPKMTIVVTP